MKNILGLIKNLATDNSNENLSHTRVCIIFALIALFCLSAYAEYRSGLSDTQNFGIAVAAILAAGWAARKGENP